MSCVPIKRYFAFESKDALCSNRDISYVQTKTCLVFESRHVLCSNQEMSCVPIKTFPRSQKGQLTGPFFQNSKRHFWSNFGERPGILPFRNLIWMNPGTIAQIRPKVACDYFVILASEKNHPKMFF